ncbi:MAG: hypothetical protein AAGF75_00480 [Cyanobacteria bacterium P01_H01_bin.130]
MAQSFGEDFIEVPVTESSQEAPQKRRYTFAPNDSYGGAGAVPQAPAEAWGAAPVQEKSEAPPPRKKPRNPGARPLFSPDLSGGIASFSGALGRALQTQGQFTMPLVSQSRSQWGAGWRALGAWAIATVFGLAYGTLHYRAFFAHKAAGVGWMVTIQMGLLLVFTVATLPILRWVRRIPVLGWMIGSMEGFLFVMVFTGTVISVLLGAGFAAPWTQLISGGV